MKYPVGQMIRSKEDSNIYFGYWVIKGYVDKYLPSVNGGTVTIKQYLVKQAALANGKYEVLDETEIEKNFDILKYEPNL